jgi:hypothetical protein
MSNRPKIFSLSFHKSGTTSLHNYLRLQGVSSLHYPKRVGGVNYAREIAPVADDPQAVLSRLMPVIEAYDAHCDAPWAGLAPELVAAFPTARFVLITRDPGQWWESLAKHWRLDLCGRYLSAFEYIQYRRYMDADRNRAYTRADKDVFISAIQKHAAEIVRIVPADRLLVCDLSDTDKAQQLAKFLELREDFEFPHLPPTSAGKPLKRLYRTFRRRLFGSDLTGGR